MLGAFLLQYSQALPWVILLLAGAWLLIVLVYPAQLRQVPGGFGWLLPLLRILAVSAIGLSILRPEVMRPRVAGERPPVVVLLDDSASMSVVDFNRAPAEWVGIAAALGRLPADARDRQLDIVQADCDRLSAQADEVIRARAELDYARLSGRPIDAAQSRLDQAIDVLHGIAHEAVSASISMRSPALDRTLEYLAQIPAGVEHDVWLDRIRDRARNAATDAEQARVTSDAQLFRSSPQVRDACRPLQALSRFQLGELALLDPVAGLLRRFDTGVPVWGFGISGQVTPMDLSRPQPDSLFPDGPITNLTGCIRAVLESFKSVPPRAIVLFSDGRLNGADLDPATLAMLQSVPIYTVGLTTRAGLKDLSITNAIVPSQATAGEKITLTAELRSFGMRDVTTTITITGGGPDETRKISFPEERPITVSFDRQFSQPGTQRVALEIAAVPGELTLDNNTIERWVNVLPRNATRRSTPIPATRPSAETEMADLTGDESFLRHLSETSGGQFFRLDQVDLLPKRLGEIQEDQSHPIEIPLWDSPFLYALVLGCLALEWGLRKRFGLV